jgi:hypothetical protein
MLKEFDALTDLTIAQAMDSKLSDSERLFELGSDTEGAKKTKSAVRRLNPFRGKMKAMNADLEMLKVHANRNHGDAKRIRDTLLYNVKNDQPKLYAKHLEKEKVLSKNSRKCLEVIVEAGSTGLYTNSENMTYHLGDILLGIKEQPGDLTLVKQAFSALTSNSSAMDIIENTKGFPKVLEEIDRQISELEK